MQSFMLLTKSAQFSNFYAQLAYTMMDTTQCEALKWFEKSLTGDNTEKIWVHRFLEKPNKIAAGGLGGAVSPPECPG